MRTVSIVDYGIGNVLSVRRAFEVKEVEVTFASDASDIIKAERLVLPGVGAFKDGMHQLEIRDLINPIREYCSSNRPFLGICLGMQMMMGESEEFGITKGLGLIPGVVKKIPDIGSDGNPHKVPHVGWNGLIRCGESWDGTILNGIATEEKVYFVHSFTAIPDDDKNRLADTYYDGCRISACIKKGNLYGTQFHPEKSGEAGLRIIKNFMEI